MLTKRETISRMSFFLGKVISERKDFEKDRNRKWVKLPQLPELIAPSFRPVASTLNELLRKRSLNP